MNQLMTDRVVKLKLRHYRNLAVLPSGNLCVTCEEGGPKYLRYPRAFWGAGGMPGGVCRR